MNTYQSEWQHEKNEMIRSAGNKKGGPTLVFWFLITYLALHMAAWAWWAQ